MAIVLAMMTVVGSASGAGSTDNERDAGDDVDADSVASMASFR